MRYSCANPHTKEKQHLAMENLAMQLTIAIRWSSNNIFRGEEQMDLMESCFHSSTCKTICRSTYSAQCQELRRQIFNTRRSWMELVIIVPRSSMPRVAAIVLHVNQQRRRKCHW